MSRIRKKIMDAEEAKKKYEKSCITGVVTLTADQCSNLGDKLNDYNISDYDTFTCKLFQDQTGKVTMTVIGDYNNPALLDEDVEL